MLVSVVLSAFTTLPAWSAVAGGATVGDGADSSAAMRVARLRDEAAVVARQYETGLREAEKQRARARRDERLLIRERRLGAALRKNPGLIARAQYHQSVAPPFVPQTLLPDAALKLMRSQHSLTRGDRAAANAVVGIRRVEDRLAADLAEASAQSRRLQKRKAELADRRRTLQAKLEEARQVLQRQADATAATGSCRGAVHLGRPRQRTHRAWGAPVESYRVSAPFGSGGHHWAHRHTGQDFAVPIGTPVRAVGAGKVVRVACGGAFGIEVVIQHPGGYFTQYAHLAAVTVDQGEPVATGQWIAQSGTTGNSTGPHLHFEVRVTPEWGSGIDPVPWLTARGVRL
ncbi:peptidoglycan DD-metalloendopeptidase family protein [Streptomyces sp. NPDC051104]|uniref:M23 family metallopeptidase n=1 Tax=Streptomyces sp. NPDC051104 TaxID=3155044 RepID=UPI0034268DE6